MASLGFRDPFSDYPAGVVDGRARLKLHGLHHVALADADLERQSHHLGGEHLPAYTPENKTQEKKKETWLKPPPALERLSGNNYRNGTRQSSGGWNAQSNVERETGTGASC